MQSEEQGVKGLFIHYHALTMNSLVYLLIGIPVFSRAIWFGGPSMFLLGSLIAYTGLCGIPIVLSRIWAQRTRKQSGEVFDPILRKVASSSGFAGINLASLSVSACYCFLLVILSDFPLKANEEFSVFLLVVISFFCVECFERVLFFSNFYQLIVLRISLEPLSRSFSPSVLAGRLRQLPKLGKALTVLRIVFSIGLIAVMHYSGFGLTIILVFFISLLAIIWLDTLVVRLILQWNLASSHTIASP